MKYMNFFRASAFTKITAILLAAVIAVSIPFPAFAASAKKKTKSSDPRVDIINSAELNPSCPQSVDLDKYLENLMSELITDDMNTFRKVLTCYDYVKNNTRYGAHYTSANMATKVGDTTCSEIYRKYGEVEGFGAVALVNHVGLCNAYASAFIMMAREIGLDAYLVRGSTKASGGGYAYHEWCEININGTAYVFDPQLDTNLARSLGEYKVFCVTYDQIPGRYIKK